MGQHRFSAEFPTHTRKIQPPKMVKLLAIVAPVALAAGVQRRKPNCNQCPKNSASACFLPGSDASHYVECSNGQPNEMECPSGLVWQQRTETCVKPWWQRSKRSLVTKHQENVCDNCTPNEYGSCYMADASPNGYIECSNGVPTHKMCPNNLVWNDELQTCDWPSSSNSNDAGSSQDNKSWKSINACSL